MTAEIKAKINADVDASIDRRAALAGLAVGLTGGLGLITASAATAQAEEHDVHQHEGHAAADGGAEHSAPAVHQSLIDAALKCVNRGEVCTNHCIGLLSKGDTSLKDCIRTVSAMLPMCAALVRLAALESPRLKELAKLCADVCEDCEKECKKHAEHHAACKACAESCRECIDACKKVT